LKKCVDRSCAFIEAQPAYLNSPANATNLAKSMLQRSAIPDASSTAIDFARVTFTLLGIMNESMNKATFIIEQFDTKVSSGAGQKRIK
jgi:hypothetical protein